MRFEKNAQLVEEYVKYPFRENSLRYGNALAMLKKNLGLIRLRFVAYVVDKDKQHMVMCGFMKKTMTHTKTIAVNQEAKTEQRVQNMFCY